MWQTCQAIKDIGSNRKADDAHRVLIYDHHDPMTTQKWRFTTKEKESPEIILEVPEERKPRWSVLASRPLVFGNGPSDEILVDVDAEREGDLLRDALAVESRIS